MDLVPPKDELFLNRITDIIRSNLSNEQFGVSQLADEMGMSRSNLYRKIKSITKVSVSQFISQVRLKYAKELLQNTELTVAEVAFESGFHSVTYFSTCFHHFFGFSPRESAEMDPSVSDSENSNPDTPSKTGPFRGKLLKWSVIAIVLITSALLLSHYVHITSQKEITEKSIGVFPFTYIGNDKEKQYLSDGMMEAILHNLSKIKDLKVMSKYSLEKYRDKDRDAIAIGKEMNLTYLLGGSFQLEGSNMKLIVQLIKTSDGSQVWSKQYSGDIKEIFSLQSSVAQKIAVELNAAIEPEEKRLIEKPPTFSLTAYEFYLRGREEYYKYSLDNKNIAPLNKAEQDYRNAIAHDPGYAKAYVGIAEVYKEKFQREKYSNAHFLDSVRILADSALVFEDKTAEAYAIKGMYYWYLGKRKQSLKEYNKALDLDPNLWEAYRGKGVLFIDSDPVKSIENYQEAASRVHGTDLKFIMREMIVVYGGAGFIKETVKYNEETLRLFGDSLLYFSCMGALEVAEGHFTTAAQWYQKAYEKDSTYTYFFWTEFDVLYELGSNLSLAGNDRESLYYFRKWLNSAEKREETKDNGLHRIGYAFWQNGFRDEAQYYFDLQLEICDKLIASKSIWAQNYYSYYDRAAVNAFLGNKEKAYHDLRIFDQKKYVPLWLVNLIKNDPLFDNLRGDPEFLEIVNNVEAKYQKGHEKNAEKLARLYKNEPNL